MVPYPGTKHRELTLNGAPIGFRKIVKILVLTNLYPPHHAGTYNMRCQVLVEALTTRGHQVHVLTSTHGIGSEQRGGEIERRLRINGAFGDPLVTSYKELKSLETTNHRVLRETCESFPPDLIYVYSLEGLSKSLIFALQNSRLPTVYSVDDYWLARDVAKDSWLRWWNNPKNSGGLARMILELFGQRSRIDAVAPTRASRADHRMPQLFTDRSALTG